MCIGGTPKVDKPAPPKDAPLPAPPPPPPEPTPVAPVVEGAGRTADKNRRGGARRRGTESLRIDLSLSQPSGSGVNIPKG